MNNTAKRFYQKLQHHMLKLGIHPGKEKILVACSGGIDSSALVHSLHTCGFSIEVAHVNYKLRDEESERNAVFVSELCKSLNVPFHITSFETKSLLESNNKNLQELARELRYQWFEQVFKDQALDFIATAHHADDQAETLIYHFIRGSSLSGLTGIASTRAQIIRPFLCFSRDEVLEISSIFGWGYSKDSSNEENKYTRNFIRNKIMPLVKEINPSISDTLMRQSQLYKEMNVFQQWSVNKILLDLIVNNDELVEDLDIIKLRSIPGFIVILFEYLRPLGFTNDQVQQISSAIESKWNGLLLHSDSHSVLVDRNVLKLCSKTDEKSTEVFSWPMDTESISLPDKSVLKRSVIEPENVISENKINVDISLFNSVLFLRHWKHGDIFCPKGMNGKSKKVSDFFIDEKVNRLEKEQKWLLVNEKDEIIWITGMRADHRFVPYSSNQSCWIYIENPNFN